MTNAHKIYVYSTTNGSHVTTLHLPSGGRLLDLAWTRHGNVVYTTEIFYELLALVTSSEVVTVSLNGSVIARTVSTLNIFTTSRMFYQSVSVFTDGAIYLTVLNLIQTSEVTTEHYVYESINEGVTWSVVFKIPENNHEVMMATKVSIDQESLVFWTRATVLRRGENKLSNYTVCVYTVTKRRDAGVNNNIITWRDINAKSCKQEDNAFPKLIFDGQLTVFTTDCRDVLRVVCE
jgi:hypothetical protein